MPAVITSIRKQWENFNSLSTVRRELLLFCLALAFSMLLLPFLVWFAGDLSLGDYLRDPSGTRRGGPFALWLDFIRGIGNGILGYWIVLLGPYVILTSLRLCRRFTKT
jgi:hypothetical protein